MYCVNFHHFNELMVQKKKIMKKTTLQKWGCFLYNVTGDKLSIYERQCNLKRAFIDHLQFYI